MKNAPPACWRGGWAKLATSSMYLQTGLMELLQLVAQHNAMVARLSTAYEGLRHYADNAAHELRTPLNRILLELEIALKQPRTDEEWRQAVSDAARDCRELTVLVDRLLFLARASSKQAGVQKQTLDLRKELGAIVAYFEAPAQDANVVMELDIEGEVQLEADRVLFQRAVTNIINNALSHTGAGGAVAMRGRRYAEFARIMISDTGSGIAAADIPHVFESVLSRRPKPKHIERTRWPRTADSARNCRVSQWAHKRCERTWTRHDGHARIPRGAWARGGARVTSIPAQRMKDAE